MLLSVGAHPLTVLQPEEHLAIVWMIRENAHMGWSQDLSLSTLQDQLSAEGPARTGDQVFSDHRAELEAVPFPSAQVDAELVERRAMIVAKALGKSMARFRRLPAVVDDAVSLEGVPRLADLSSAPMKLDWLRALGSQLGMALTDGMSSTKWLYGLCRMGPAVAHATVASLSTQTGSEDEWRAAVLKVRADGTMSPEDRASMRSAADAATAAAAVAMAAGPGAGANFDSSVRPLRWAADFVRRVIVRHTQASIDALAAGAAAAAAGAPDVGDENEEATRRAQAATVKQIAVLLADVHKVHLLETTPAPVYNACAGGALKAVAEVLDLSPEGMQASATDDDTEDLAEGEILAHAIDLKARWSTAVATARPAAGAGRAAPPPSPQVMTLDQTSLTALAAGRASSGGRLPPGPDDVLRVGKSTAAQSSDAYVAAGDTPLFFRVRAEIETAARAAQSASADVFAIAGTLSSDATKMLAKIVHPDDKTNEPRLSFLTELQELIADGALLVVRQFFKVNTNLVYASAAFPAAKVKATKTAFAAMRRSSLTEGGPHVVNPYDGGPTDLFGFLLARFQTCSDEKAHKLRDKWSEIFRLWGKVFEALAGAATGMALGTAAIVEFLDGSGTSDGFTKWTPQQEAWYVGILLWRWHDLEQLWRSNLSATRLSLAEVATSQWMVDRRLKMHELGVSRPVPRETPFTELAFGGGSVAQAPAAAPAAAKATPEEAKAYEDDAEAKRRKKKKPKTADAHANAMESQLKELRATVKKLTQAGRGGGGGGGGFARGGGGAHGGDTGLSGGGGRGTGGKGGSYGATEAGISARSDGENRAMPGACQRWATQVAMGSSVLKNVCIHCIAGVYGCRFGGDLGGIGGCGHAHGAHPDDKPAIQSALQELTGECETPQFHDEFWNAKMTPSHTGRGKGSASASVKNEGKGKGDSSGGGKNGGRGGGKGGGRGRGTP